MHFKLSQLKSNFTVVFTIITEVKKKEVLTASTHINNVGLLIHVDPKYILSVC